MTAFNVVRFKVRPGMEEMFLDAHRATASHWPGLRHANIISTGGGGFCIIAEWESADVMSSAMPSMIKTLDSFRHALLELGEGRGVTDPASGPVVLPIR